MLNKTGLKAGTLPSLLRRAIIDAEFKTKLLEAPTEVAEIYGLTEVEFNILKRLRGEHLDAIVGGLISHKLIPRRVGKRIVVVPNQFSAPINDDIIPIWIDQRKTGAYIDTEGKAAKRGRAFGSGVHPTTSLCLRALEEHFECGMVVLDLGTGTGILAIAAAKLGAKHVIALDIDEHALKIALENLATNGVDDIVKLCQGSLDAVINNRKPRFHLIVTNILASVHQANIQLGLADLLYPKGKIIFSGMIEPEAMTLESALAEVGCQPISRMRQRQWVALISQKITPGM